jgi:hypothetical protein
MTAARNMAKPASLLGGEWAFYKFVSIAMMIMLDWYSQFEVAWTNLWSLSTNLYHSKRLSTKPTS